MKTCKICRFLPLKVAQQKRIYHLCLFIKEINISKQYDNNESFCETKLIRGSERERKIWPKTIDFCHNKDSCIQ